MKPPCAICERDLLAYALGELTPDAARAYERHLADVPACREEARSMAALYRATRALPEPEPSAAILAKLRAEAAAATASPRRGGLLSFLLARPWGVPLWAPALAAGLVVVVLVRQRDQLTPAAADKGDVAARAVPAAPVVAQMATPASTPAVATDLKAFGYVGERAKDQDAAARQPADKLAAKNERDESRLATAAPARELQAKGGELKRTEVVAQLEKEKAAKKPVDEPVQSIAAATEEAPSGTAEGGVAGGTAAPEPATPPALVPAPAPQKAAATLSDDASAERLRRADLDLAADKLDAAEASLEELSRTAATPARRAEALLRLGDIYSRRGHAAQARQAYQRAAVLDPERQSDVNARLKLLPP